MKNIYKHIVFLIIITVTFLTFNLRVASAQSLNLSISPTIIELLIRPGKSVLIAYNVENNGDPLVLLSGVTSFKPVGITGQVQLEPELSGPVRFSLDNSQLKLGQGVFLNSHDKQQYLLKIRVPPNVEEGDYYYTFYVQSDSGALLSGTNQSKSSATIGANILISVSDSGKTESNGVIAKFYIISKSIFNFLNKKLLFFDSQDPIALQLIVQNTGKNMMKPYGAITLTGSLGERATYKLTPVNIIAHSDRIIPATPSGQINCTNSNTLCDTPLSLVLNGFFVGKYRFGADFNFGPGTANLYSSVTFYALPIKLTVLLGITLIVSIVIIRHLKRKEENDDLFEE